MRYSFEFKLKCIELYRSGRWPKTPDGVLLQTFHKTIRTWSEIEKRNGPEALRHPKHQRTWSPEDKLVLVSQVLAGNSLCSVAYLAGINSGMLCQWVRKYKEEGYNGLVNKRKGRKPKEPSMKKKKSDKPQPLTESEREELIRLREENAYMKAEIAFRKKLIALRREKWAEQHLKAKKQKPSKRSDKKDSR
ncbi:helix-turn-helix domain-containing protein [Pseudoramibacter sp.]|jgi:transposase-like protein|uniref:helix-turn-helix domain-containing protein n=1 Tax=Pseudoramibacter sp. TaxID=2034862 RepID=UPI0025EE81E2|nr:helix-turn-helix domain-containing protein [Pseudoramibacter sp.]MCH4071707.1 transposase [Pseudoramibacter sp.]MCH4105475.1 transposase [Pseudoramibacter sp.]